MNGNKENEGERLQKVLATAGHGSRRTVEDWIRGGRVTVNGRIAQLGDRARPGDDVRVDGRQLQLASPSSIDREVLIYHKPLGEVTTRRDPQDRPTVFERLPPVANGRWINVGRLDVNTSGLLLFTTDGELAHRLMHPSTEVEREYLVRVRGQPGPDAIRRLQDGVELEDGPARFDRVFASRTDGSHGWFHVVLREGRNREVRRTWEAVGFDVSRLMRIRYGPIELPRDLAPGGWRKAPALLIEQLMAASTSKPGSPVAAGASKPGSAVAVGASKHESPVAASVAKPESSMPASASKTESPGRLSGISDLRRPKWPR